MRAHDSNMIRASHIIKQSLHQVSRGLSKKGCSSGTVNTNLGYKSAAESHSTTRFLMQRSEASLRPRKMPQASAWITSPTPMWWVKPLIQIPELSIIILPAPITTWLFREPSTFSLKKKTGAGFCQWRIQDRAFFPINIVNLGQIEPFRSIVEDYFKRFGRPSKMLIKISPLPNIPTDENEEIFPNKLGIGVPLTARLEIGQV